MSYRFARLAATAVLILGTSACGSGSGPDFIWLRAMHAMPDTPTLQVTHDNFVFRRDVSYGTTTSEGGESLLSEFGPATRLIARYTGPGDTDPSVLFDLEMPVEKDHTSTVIFAGGFDAPEAITVVTPRLQRPLAAANFQFVHAALDIGPIDIYVTAPDTELTATAPRATLQPRDHSELFEVPFGTTRVRLTPAGTLDVLMDSGELDFSEQDTPTGPGMQWLFAVAPSVAAGPSPVLLIGSTGREGFRLYDEGTPATVRALHALPETPAVDLVVDADPDVTLFTGLEYGTYSPILASPTGDVTLEFRLSGSGEPVASVTNTLLQQGLPFTLFLIGPVEAPRAISRGIPPTAMVTESRIRFANLAPDSKFFSIYLTATAEEELEAGNRVVRDLRFGGILDHIRRAPGDYFVTITERFFADAAGAADAEETLVLGPLPLELSGGDVLTWALLAPEVEGGHEILLTINDLAP